MAAFQHPQDPLRVFLPPLRSSGLSIHLLGWPTNLFEMGQGGACGISWLEGLRAKPCLSPAVEALGRPVDFPGLQGLAYNSGVTLLAIQLSTLSLPMGSPKPRD